MKSGTPIESLTKAIEHSGLTDPYSYSVTMFEQTWASTALGFGGIGGQALTGAYTVIIDNLYTAEYSVYFGGRFAYKVDNPNKTFFEDIANQDMSQVLGHKKRYARITKESE